MFHCQPDNQNQQWELPSPPADRCAETFCTATVCPDGLPLPKRNSNDCCGDLSLCSAVSTIRNRSGICIDAPFKDRPSEVQMFGCDGHNPNQRWVYNEHTGQIRVAGGLCLDAPQRGTVGSRLIVYTCEEGNLNQQWHYDWKTGLITQKHGVICVDAPNRNQNESPLILYHCNRNNPNQQWEIRI